MPKNVFAVAYVSEKTPLDWRGEGCILPLGCHENTLHLTEKLEILIIDVWDIFDNTGKESFRFLKSEVRIKQKS